MNKFREFDQGGAEPGITYPDADRRYVNENEGYIKPEIESLLSGYYKKDEVYNKTETLNKRELYSKNEIDNMRIIDQQSTYNKDEIDSKLVVRTESKEVQILPRLTSNLSDNSIIIATEVDNENAFKALDRIQDTFWRSTEATTFGIIFDKKRKITMVYTEGSIARGTMIKASLDGATWVSFTITTITNAGTQGMKFDILNPNFYKYYQILFHEGITLKKLEMYEKQMIIKDLLLPVEARDAAPKEYVDFIANALEAKIESKKIKSYTGYIPILETAVGYQSLGYQVTAENTFTGSTPYYIFNGTWIGKIKNWINIQLPEPIRIWKFALKGNKDNKNQPKSFILKGGNIGSEIYTNILSVDNANLQPGYVKYFEVDSKIKFPVYRIEITIASTPESDRIVLSYFQIFPILELI